MKEIAIGTAQFYDEEGCGPDHVYLLVQDHPAIPEIPSEPNGRLWFNVRLVPAEDAVAVVQGGFILPRETVERLYNELGAWLVLERDRAAKAGSK